MEMGIEVLEDEGKLHIITSPRATRFGCWEAPQASKPRLLCIYDQKPEETPTKVEGGMRSPYVCGDCAIRLIKRRSKLGITKQNTVLLPIRK
ncbi:hypothetical protein OESDEN_23717 [Oesophagostomum dentatum]|uniref:Uncharacterized protein n=1 Tax=Oesophagostomum dentatum TaxID=61180 RepID=A0A0B1RUC3_OESDE|nr:hypothetical protein OESDEN_23717 [Oesophagostomum dentatum]